MIYLHLNVSRKRDAQKKFIKYIQSAISEEPKIDELLNRENKEEILDWLDDL
jgi:mannitol/fructose-specific phosphotransferase system IIA component (Ntr-type)